MGHSTDTLKAKLSGVENFKTIGEENDVIALLKAINKIAFRFEAHNNLHDIMWSMKKQVLNARQNNLYLAQYLENSRYVTFGLTPRLLV